MAREFDQTQDTTDFVKTAPGADAAKVQALLTKLIEARLPGRRGAATSRN